MKQKNSFIRFWLYPWMVFALCGTCLGACAPATLEKTNMQTMIPKPVSVTPGGQTFTLGASAKVIVERGSDETLRIGTYLAEHLRPATGFALPVETAGEAQGNLLLLLNGAATLGEEGYELTVEPDGVKLAAYRPAGLFWGVQTLRQWLPAAIEAESVQPGPWTMETGKISDQPRFAYRGMMLDVTRHFFGVSDVKRLIDLLAYYKINRLHLHLSDDQGWRIVIDSWPRLAEIGGNTVGVGGKPGIYSKADYKEIVEYAQSRYIVVIPEIDTPGHTNAALSSYAELNTSGVAPAPYTQFEVGFSSLDVHKEMTYKFLDDVVRELAEITPGPYIHIGGDEASATKDEDYQYFMERIQKIVLAHGKQMMAWEESATTPLDPSSVVQLWRMTQVDKAVKQKVKMVLSPAKHAYLDMKYTSQTRLGLTWAAIVEVKDAYNWEPTTQAAGAPESSILGVEAPLWSETLITLQDVEFLTFPRLLGHAEIGWSAKNGRNWDEYRQRLGAHGSRLTALKVNYYASPQVEWK